MQQNKKDLIFKALRRLAIVKGEECGIERLQIYCERLVEYELDKINSALETLFETKPKFPDISDIINLIEPKLTETDKGVELSAAVLEAIKTFGHYQAVEAKNALGNIGWYIVEGMGGWNALCMMTYDELGTLRAQMRDLGKAAIKISSRPDSENMLEFQRQNNKKLNNPKPLGDLLPDFTQ